MVEPAAPQLAPAAGMAKTCALRHQLYQACKVDSLDMMVTAVEEENITADERKMIPSTDYGHTKAKSLTLWGPKLKSQSHITYSPNSSAQAQKVLNFNEKWLHWESVVSDP